MRLINLVLSCIGGAIFCVDEAHSATIHVPADYSTINAALDAASSGDIVEVAPGIYDQYDSRPGWYGDDSVSSLGFLKSGVVLRSSGGADVTTLRMDSTTERAVILLGGAGEFDVEGFTFTGTIGELMAVAVGVPFGTPNSLHLQDCVFRDYAGSYPGTAIHGNWTTLHVQNCEFSNIDSPGASAAYVNIGSVLLEDSSFENCTGGALSAENSDPLSQVSVKRCSFKSSGNELYSQGAISIQRAPTLVEDSYFFRNYAGILYGCPEGSEDYSTLIVRNSTFAETSGSLFIPAICAVANSAELTGNTFYGGKALDYSGALRGGGTLTLERNVVSFSCCDPSVQVAGTVQSGCNVFWQNSGGNTAGFSLGATDLVADPQFCDAPAQDFTVNAASPCLPWNNNGCGQIGAWGLGCGSVSVEPSSWGQIKALYR